MWVAHFIYFVCNWFQKAWRFSFSFAGKLSCILFSLIRIKHAKLRTFFCFLNNFNCWLAIHYEIWKCVLRTWIVFVFLQYWPMYSKTFYGRGETLTSISKQYGVSRYSVSAANKNILDVDLVFEGQFLNIPASAPADTQVVSRVALSFTNGLITV